MFVFCLFCLLVLSLVVLVVVLVILFVIVVWVQVVIVFVVDVKVVQQFEIVIVIGICVLLESVLNKKCEEFGIVDVICVEDIGKFLDINFVELLQCVFGVVIDCDVGEGCQIIVCGFGGDFMCM